MKTLLAILGTIYLIALASSVIVLIVIACKAF